MIHIDIFCQAAILEISCLFYYTKKTYGGETIIMKRKAFLWILMVAVVLAANGAVATAAIRSSANQRVAEETKEPALVFERETSWASWKYVNGHLLITFKVENLEHCVSIDAFDLTVYCENAYEERINEGSCYEYTTFTLDRMVEAGSVTFSGYCNLADYANIKYVYAAISRYHYVKGSTPSGEYLEANEKNTVTIAFDDLEFYSWTID